MKKLLALMLALLMAATMMVACQNGKRAEKPEAYEPQGHTHGGFEPEIEVPTVEIPEQVAPGLITIPELTEPEIEIPPVEIPEQIAPDLITIPELTEPETEEPAAVLTAEEEAMLSELTGGFIESLETSGGGMLKGSYALEGSTLKLICTYQMTFDDATIAVMAEQMDATMASMMGQLTPMGDLIKNYVPSIDSVVIVYDDLAGSEVYSFEI